MIFITSKTIKEGSCKEKIKEFETPHLSPSRQKKPALNVTLMDFTPSGKVYLEQGREERNESEA